MTTLVLIPARGGSKRLPGKNLRRVGDKTLVAHAVYCGVNFLEAAQIDGRIFCDTDSFEIAHQAALWGASVPWLREPEYAQDDTTSAATVIRTLERLHDVGRRFDSVLLLQPTSPLRTVQDVLDAWNMHVKVDRVPVATTSHGKLANGAVYVITPEDLAKHRTFTPPNFGTLYVSMPHERSIDINTAADLAEAERLWQEQYG